MRRTHLPLNALRVFDAAARHLSFTKAADELAVTPAAVGQQIRALEDVLGVILFRRAPKGLELTPEAEAGLDALRQGFLLFEDAVRAMQAGQGSNVLAIAAPRDFTSQWLAMRLAAFAAAYPDVRFTLLQSEGESDFTESNLDIAVWLTDGPGEHEGIALGEGHMLPVAAPGYAGDAMIGWPGCPAMDVAPVLQLADAGLAIDAAASGLGMAVVPALLAEGALASGRLVVKGEAQESGRRYWLVAPSPQWRQKKVKALVEFLTTG